LAEAGGAHLSEPIPPRIIDPTMRAAHARDET
jgi:hypothetical protein